MMDPPTIGAWLYCFDSDGVVAQHDIEASLARAGVNTIPLDLESPTGLGIVVFSEATPHVCDFIRQHSRNGLGLLLAVTTSQNKPNEAAWRVLQAGATDVLTWDRPQFSTSAIVARLERWQAVDAILKSSVVQGALVGSSRVWVSLLRQVIEAACFTDASILLTGETGTGKELVARLIHALSPRRNKRELVLVDCTTIVPELSGSELFGHERGAFTGAVAARDGAFALANGGTLFLDEVGELAPGLQSQLLRVVQEHTFKRVGSNTWHTTDFRLVCATNRDLLHEEAQGRFRRDLYYRIASWTFALPPLRDRPEDILPLARHFMQQLHPDQEPVELDEPVQEYLLTRHYPGNVRDLRNLALRMAYRHIGPGPITVGDIPADERPPVAPDRDSWQHGAFEQSVRQALLYGAGLREIRRVAEDTAIRIAIDEENNNLQRAARRLDVTDRALQMRRAEQRQRSAPGSDSSAQDAT
jgi:transcriptional regulator with GAF, ATPase, and Fis domain